MDIGVGRLAELAKIDFTEAELAALTEDMRSIVALMDSLRAVQLPEEGDAPGLSLPLAALRVDASRPGLDPAVLTAPAAEGQGFRIPRVVE